MLKMFPFFTVLLLIAKAAVAQAEKPAEQPDKTLAIKQMLIEADWRYKASRWLKTCQLLSFA